ncbi:uncharacterized protein [Littorina saxatilis]|uniref:uncharacterized protein n=1 Tax=Littorina saxatilis TaxID=31220 RepID=UPI0038B57C74
MSTPAGNQQTGGNNWRQIVTSLYPDALTQTYCVPPVHFNRVPYDRIHVPGTGHAALQLLKPGAAPAHNVPQVSQRPVPPSRHSQWTQKSQPQVIPGRVQKSDLQDDLAQTHVMLNLQKIATIHKEVMFILSQLSFGNYLNQPAYAAAAAELPRPSQIDTKKIKYSHGEADFVLIHHYNGILIGELKSIGRNQADVNNPQPPADADVAKRVTKAVKQLDRSETVVRHLVSDVAPDLTVRKTIFLPYVSTKQLQRVLDNDQQLKQRVSDKMMHCTWKLDALTVKTGHWLLNKSQGLGGPGHNITMVGRQKLSLLDRGRAIGWFQDGVGVREIARRLLWCGGNLPYANTVLEPPYGSSSVQQA